MTAGDGSSVRRTPTVVGVGYSAFTRGASDSSERLTLTACREALRDAGLQPQDVDGIFGYRFGSESPDCHVVQRLLGVPDLAAWADVEITGPSGLAAALQAIMAVASGACEVAIAFRCITQSAAHMGASRDGPEAAYGVEQYMAPYGVIRTFNIQNIAMKMQRRVSEFGASFEDYAQVALNARRWSALNERALLREPLTLDDYFGREYLAEPLRILDCDYPVSGAVATIFCTAERARDVRSKPVYVDAFAYGSAGDSDWLFADDFVYGGARTCAERLWSRASFGPNDLDIIQVYDGFTHSAVAWVEALGLCGLGEFGGWIESGARTAPGGALPMNTGGGHLAEGRLHAMNLLNEAVLQLRGECGLRQAPNANLAAVTSGLAAQCAALTLRNEFT